jgi:hypothetical protein
MAALEQGVMIASLLKVCMVRRRSAILIFGFALVLAGCGGGISFTPNSTPVIQSSSGTTSFALVKSQFCCKSDS